MTAEIVRTHVLLPRDLVEAVDRLVGQRRRSQFVAEAVAEKLARGRRSAAFAKAAGSINLADYPHWSTPERISAWVHDLRAAEDQASMRPWREREESRRTTCWTAMP